ncbi:hypothetical protein CHGG_02257 [Chaetomium globosum CBS 148.51]|uniref:NADP-dependent oxidoreductase domain-containing protein n=1 Tax=Chaetomium globosum (strain ATCC 6205 / CBS 148.51 / DSM 1962 / NBRC 6347 / NRRL 1970) TaxID=306901 RepID=Q2HBZ7_CHAGB|nr:uncharacterized protein CHGG_02257 [Chaetomium globosum CBS 148.51]EAQ90322.1 hypothetical protein CHGG_02257 [Chaetomium globosum CBS 148.51]
MPVVVTRNQFVGLKVVNGAPFKAVDIFPDLACGTIALANDVTFHLGPPVAVLLQSDDSAGLAIPGLPNGTILVKSKTVAIPSQMRGKEGRWRGKPGFRKIDAVQAEFSAFDTLHETDGLIDAARDLGVAYVAYGPLGHGWLVDDFAYNSPDDFGPTDGRRGIPKFQGENFYNNRAIVRELQKLAAKKGCATTQVALAWVAAQGFIAIPGTTKAHWLEENWASRDVELTEAEMAEMRRIVEEAKPKGARYSEALQKMVGIDDGLGISPA